MTVRWCGEWGAGEQELPATMEVLVPSFERPAELAVMLSGHAGQGRPDFSVVVSDRSPQPVWLEPGTLERLFRVLADAGCGFIGAAVQGLSYPKDRRPAELEAFMPWRGHLPERIRPGSAEFSRWRLHNAAGVAHLAPGLGIGRSGDVALRRRASGIPPTMAGGSAEALEIVPLDAP